MREKTYKLCLICSNKANTELREETQLILILYHFHYWLPSSSLTLPGNYLTSEVSHWFHSRLEFIR